MPNASLPLPENHTQAIFSFFETASLKSTDLKVNSARVRWTARWCGKNGHQHARRYALVLEELAETINLNEALGEPSASVAGTLFAAIDVEEALHRSAPNTALSAGANLAKRA